MLLTSIIIVINISFKHYENVKLSFQNVKINAYYLIISIIIKNEFIIN